MPTKTELEQQLLDAQTKLAEYEAADTGEGATAVNVEEFTERLETLIFKDKSFLSNFTPRQMALRLLALPPDEPFRCEHCNRMMPPAGNFPDGIEPWCYSCRWNHPEAPAADPSLDPVPADHQTNDGSAT